MPFKIAKSELEMVRASQDERYLRKKSKDYTGKHKSKYSSKQLSELSKVERSSAKEKRKSTERKTIGIAAHKSGKKGNWRTVNGRKIFFAG